MSYKWNAKCFWEKILVSMNHFTTRGPENNLLVDKEKVLFICLSVCDILNRSHCKLGIMNVSGEK